MVTHTEYTKDPAATSATEPMAAVRIRIPSHTATMPTAVMNSGHTR